MFLSVSQMAKNKGLTPKRKKIDRNPRVKHREKFRRAKIRRKGQVCVLKQGVIIIVYYCCCCCCRPLFVSGRTSSVLIPCFCHQVRQVRREETKYSGELSGIRAGVKKSVKLN